MLYLRTYLLFFTIFSSVCSALGHHKENIFPQQLFRNKTHYIILWNAISGQTFDNIIMYTKEKNIKVYELIRSFFHSSLMRVKWINHRYGYSLRINFFDQVFTNHNFVNSNKKNGYIGLFSGDIGVFISYNNNGGGYKDMVNIGGFMALGLLWSRPYLLIKNEILKLLKEWRSYVNFDILFHISPLYIQFKDFFFISINYKLGIIDLVKTFKNKKPNDGVLGHFLSGLCLSLGIY